MRIIKNIFCIICFILCVNFANLYAQISHSDSVFLAIKNNNLEKIKQWKLSVSEINLCDENGASLLMWAVYKGNIDMVKYLYKQGANTQKKGILFVENEYYYGNLTGIAAGENKLDILKYLIEECLIEVDDKEIHYEDTSSQGWTALQWACAKGNLEIAKYLISKGANINCNHTKDGVTPLIYAVQINNAKVVKFLLSKNADPNLADGSGNYPLHHAIYNKNMEIINLLIKYKANPAVETNNKYNCLHFAAYVNYTDVVPLLLSKGIALNSKTIAGDSPLIIAIENNKFEFANYIIKLGADINQGTNENWKPIHLAARQGSIDILKNLINSGANINDQTACGKTALLLAAYNNEIRCVNFLVTKGAKIELSDTLGDTPLSKAKEFNYLKVIEILSSGKAIPDEPEWDELNSKYLEFSKLEKYQEALPMAKLAIKEAKKEFGEKHLSFSKALNNLGFAHLNVQNYDSAEIFMSAAIFVMKNVKNCDTVNLITYHTNLADIQNHLKKYRDAAINYNNAIMLGELYYKNDEKELNEIYLSTAQFYEKLSNYSQAIIFYNKAIERYEKKMLFSNPEYTTALNNLGSVYDNLGNRELAEETMLKCLRIREQFMGTDNLNYANTLNNIAVFYENQRLYENAINYHLQSLKIRKKIVGKNSLEYVVALQNLGSLYLNMNEYSKAIPIFSETKSIFEENNYIKNHYYAITLKGLAKIAEKEGNFDLAEQYYIQALNNRKHALAENHEYILFSLSDLAIFYQTRFQLQKSDSLYNICIDVLKKDNKTETENYISFLMDQGTLYISMDRLDDAEKKYIEVYERAKKIYDTTSVNFAYKANGLASYYYFVEQYSKALALYNPIIKILNSNKNIDPANYLAIGAMYTRTLHYYNLKKQSDSMAVVITNYFEKQSDKVKYNTPNTVSNIANCYKQLGKYEKTEANFIASINLIEKLYGKYIPDYITTMNALADFYQLIGKNDLAIKTNYESMLIAEKAFGSAHIKYANTIDALANQYINMSQWDKAEQLLLKSYEIKSNISDSSKEIQNTLASLGKLYQRLGQYEKAGKYFLRNATLVKKIYGKEHPNSGHALNNLCVLFKEMNYTKGVDTLYFKVIDNFKKNYGENSLQYATALHNLASYYVDVNLNDKADSLFDKTLNIEKVVYNNDASQYYNTLNSIAVQKFKQKKFIEAESLYLETYKIVEKKFGKLNPITSTITTNLALLYQELENINKATYWFNLTNENIKLQIQDFYPTLSEKEKQSFFTTISSSFELINSFALRNYHSNHTMSSVIYNNVLATRSILLESTKKIKNFAANSSDTSINKLYQDWNEKFNYLGQMQLYSALEREQLGINIDEISEQVNKLEKTLTLKYQEINKDFTVPVKDWTELKKNLSKDYSLVDFTKIRYHNGKEWTDTSFYIALIITNECQNPILIKLTDENKLSKRILYSDKKMLSAHIYQMLWQPIEPIISNKKNLYLSCDGLTNLISFDGLKDKNGTYLTDKYNIHYLTSNRNFISVVKNEDKIYLFSSAILIGSPDYNLTIEEMISNNFSDKNNTQILTQSKTNYRRGAKRGEPWEYLPGTLKEIDTIAQIFLSNKIKTNTFLSKDATEENFKKIDLNKYSDIIHIATHGFYIPIDNSIIASTTDKTEYFNENPLLRSGLILTGGNNAWIGNNPPEIIEDGILTAYEVSNMNLFNTKLAVLSACETGVGDIKSGEGVFGLKRAFKLAGVDKLLLSLWEIPDLETAEMMTIFYSQIAKNQSIYNSFKYAQREMRNKYPSQPELWAGFILME